MVEGWLAGQIGADEGRVRKLQSLAQLQTMEINRRKMAAEDEQSRMNTKYASGITPETSFDAKEIMRALQLKQITPVQAAQAFKDIKDKAVVPNYNQAFNPDGSPNLPYQAYQQKLKEKPDAPQLPNYQAVGSTKPGYMQKIQVMPDGTSKLIGEPYPQFNPSIGQGGTGNTRLSVVTQKEIIETDEKIQGANEAIIALGKATKINNSAFGFPGAGMAASALTILPDGMIPKAALSTQDLDNLITGIALPQLKATFGGMPTEGERKVLLEMQGSSSKTPAVRKLIFERAEAAVKRRILFDQQKAKDLRAGKYFQEAGTPDVDPAQSGEWKDL